MSLLKRLFPAAAKDVTKGVLNAALAPIGWKLAPINSVVTDGPWYNSPVDGVVSRHRPPALDDQRFRAAVEHLRKHNAFNDLEAAARGEVVLYRLYLAGQLASVAKHVEGEFVEFGTFRGATAYCMLDATRDNTPTKQIYLYDTFEGIPTDGVTTHEREVGLVGAYRDTSVNLVRENLSTFESRVHIRQGLIPHTLDDGGPSKIAMMHVDLNLAKPTVDALTWAYPRWSAGGICLLDDYLWEGYEDQREVVEEFFRQRDLTIVALPTGQGMVLHHSGP
jgi:predicted O-methyltransferase YrrM